MAHPLELSYRWQPPVLFATVGAVVVSTLVATGGEHGWGAVIALVVVLWAVLVGLVWARTRAYLMVDGPRLTVRRVRHRHTFRGDQVVRVRQFLTAAGPSYRLVVREDDGHQSSYVAPVALLRAGHSTLFTWILAQAPQAELDRGTTRTLDQLRVRGLVL